MPFSDMRPWLGLTPTIPLNAAGIRHEPLSRERFSYVQRIARAVVASAGSQLISECVAHGTPLLALHAPEDDEQALNVAMLRQAGIGDGFPITELDQERRVLAVGGDQTLELGGNSLRFDLAAPTYADPRQMSEGTVEVWVNGVSMLRDGQVSRAMPGRVLRRTAPAAAGWADRPVWRAA